MFRIGEFSRIARVSGRLLRYYDSIGLLSPQHVDPATGYRYYSASQLAPLNRILALKDLGLTLDQVARLVEGKIAAAEIRGMLTLKKVEIEQTLSEETARLRHIESRLKQIEEEGSLADYDVIVKSVEAQPFISVRRRFAGMDRAVEALHDVARSATRQIPIGARQSMIVIAYSDFDDEELDLAIGFSLTRDFRKPVILASGDVMTPGELPGVDRLATLARRGPIAQAHVAFGALGLWMEANGCNIAGPSREIFLDAPFGHVAEDETVMEIQFPVAGAA